jgi:hypothetical protein
MPSGFVLPRVNELHPEEILKVRDTVKSTREGFSMHLQTLSSSVDARIRDGEDLNDIARYARDVVETQLVPDYVEFRRQMVAEQAGSWKRVLRVADSVLKIDAAPWTPKFYGDLLKALGFYLLESVEQSKEGFSNRRQAMQFLATLERRQQL